MNDNNAHITNMLKEFKNNNNLKNIIVENSPSGVIIVDIHGIIKYINPAIGKILGSMDTVGLNILEFDTVKKSLIYDGILSGLKGNISEFKNESYTSFTTNVHKNLNIYIYPKINSKTHKVENLIILIHDVTEEHLLNKKIEQNYLQVLEALASLVDAKDYYTGEHSKNVSRYVSIMCENMKFESNKLKNDIKIAASFHDIGKIGIPDAILNKNGFLTEEEYSIIKQHSVIGADVINKITDFKAISDIIRHHHERWDGGGYPDKLMGVEIPFGSQIIAIADSFDAITSDRIYRKGRSIEVAIDILIKGKGKQFNPELVDIFIANLGKDL